MLSVTVWLNNSSYIYDNYFVYFIIDPSVFNSTFTAVLNDIAITSITYLGYCPSYLSSVLNNVKNLVKLL